MLFDPEARVITKLQDVVLGSTAASLVLSALPPTYTLLRVYFAARSTKNDHEDAIAVRLNGDSGNNYDQAVAQTYQGISQPFESAQTNAAYGLEAPAALCSAGRFGLAIVEFPFYADATQKKHIWWQSGHGEHGAGFSRSVGHVYTTWDSTAVVTSITFYPVTGPNLAAGTRAVLYGVL